VVAEAVGDRLEHRAKHVAARVAQVQAGEHAARVGVVDRRLLAQEVGQGNDAARARAGGVALGVQLGERRAAADFALEPANQAAGRGHAAVRQPAVRRQVVVQVQALVDERRLGRQQDVPRSAELDQQVALVEQARGESRRDVIGGSRDDRHAGPKAGCRRGGGGDRADHVA
jgi:hypothetical protein